MKSITAMLNQKQPVAYLADQAEGWEESNWAEDREDRMIIYASALPRDKCLTAHDRVSLARGC